MKSVEQYIKLCQKEIIREKVGNEHSLDRISDLLDIIKIIIEQKSEREMNLLDVFVKETARNNIVFRNIKLKNKMDDARKV